MNPKAAARLLATTGLMMSAATATSPAYAGTSDTFAFSVHIPFTRSANCPSADCVGSGSAGSYGTARAVLTGSGFDLATWVLTLSTTNGALVLDLQPDNSNCTTPGRSGDIPRPPSSQDFGNPVSCTMSYVVAGGTGAFTNAAGGQIEGSFGFAGSVLTLSGVGNPGVSP